MTAHGYDPGTASAAAPTTPELAEKLAAIVRLLNHRTLERGAFTGPEEPGQVIHSVSLAVSRLPQLITQCVRYLVREYGEGRIAVPSGQYIGRPDAAVAAAELRRDAAIAAAEALWERLEGLAQVMDSLAVPEDSSEGGEGDG